MMSLLARFTILLCYFGLCHSVELWYDRKVVSNVKHDCFGKAMDVTKNHLVVGAPYDNSDHSDHYGSVYVGHGVKISAPLGFSSFGSILATNEHYIVIGGNGPQIVYVYTAVQPYSLVAKLDGLDEVRDVAIDNDNTIVVGVYQAVHVFRFDGRSSWHREKTWTYTREYDYGPRVSIYGDLVAVGLPYANHYTGIIVHLYHKADGQWQHTQTLTLHSKDFRAGGLVKINKDRLVVLAYTQWFEISQIFVYKFDRFLDLWIPDGIILDHFIGGCWDVDVENDLIAAPVNDPSRNTTVSTVYKKKDGDWMPYSHLTAEKFVDMYADPETGNCKVRINGNYVYTSREIGPGFGAVFVHDLSQIH